MLTFKDLVEGMRRGEKLIEDEKRKRSAKREGRKSCLQQSEK
jgi:hypothetical protein